MHIITSALVCGLYESKRACIHQAISMTLWLVFDKRKLVGKQYPLNTCSNTHFRWDKLMPIIVESCLELLKMKLTIHLPITE